MPSIFRVRPAHLPSSSSFFPTFLAASFVVGAVSAQPAPQPEPPASAPSAPPGASESAPNGSRSEPAPNTGSQGSEDEDYEVDASSSTEPGPAQPAQAPSVSPVAPTGTESEVSASATGDVSAPPVTPAPTAAGNEPVVEPAADEKSSGAGTAVQKPKGAVVDKEGSNYRRKLVPGFAVSGFVQAQYQSSQLSEDQLDADGAPLNQDEFAVRRARIRLDHGWSFGFATLEVDAGTIGGAQLRLRRAEASLLYRGTAPVDVTPWIVLTAGVTDIPFGLELGESQRDRLFMEQSIASRALFPTPADIGAKLWGAYEFVDYSVAVINGEPTDGTGFPTDPNAHKDVTGRFGFRVKPSDLSFIGGGASFYVGQGFSHGVPGSKDSLQWVDINNNGVVESSEIQGVTASSALPSRNFERWAAALDFSTRFPTPIGLLRIGAEAYLASNMDRGVLPSDPVVLGGDAVALGGSLYLTSQIGDYVLVGVRSAYYDPNSNLIEQRAGTFHLQDQSFIELSPSVAVMLESVRLSAEYDWLWDHLGRSSTGVPTDARNDRFTLRLQVDL